MAINLGDISRFKYLAHKVMPLVFDETLSYYEFLCKVIAKLNEVIDNENEQNTAIEQMSVNIDEWEEAAIQRYNEFTAAVDLAIEQFEQRVTESQESFEESIRDRADEFEETMTERADQFEDDITDQQDDFETEIRGAWDEFFQTYLQTLGVVQTTGTSTTDVMSQNATTTELDKKLDKSAYSEWLPDVSMTGFNSQQNCIFHDNFHRTITGETPWHIGQNGNAGYPMEWSTFETDYDNTDDGLRIVNNKLTWDNSVPFTTGSRYIANTPKNNFMVEIGHTTPNSGVCHINLLYMSKTTGIRDYKGFEITLNVNNSGKGTLTFLHRINNQFAEDNSTVLLQGVYWFSGNLKFLFVNDKCYIYCNDTLLYIQPFALDIDGVIGFRRMNSTYVYNYDFFNLYEITPLNTYSQGYMNDYNNYLEYNTTLHTVSNGIVRQGIDSSVTAQSYLFNKDSTITKFSPYSEKFDLKYDAETPALGERSEMVFTCTPKSRLRKMKFEFDVYFPDTYISDSKTECIFQINSTAQNGTNSYRPQWNINSINGNLGIRIWGQANPNDSTAESYIEFPIGELQTEKWYHFEIFVKEGYMQSHCPYTYVKLDGQTILEYNQPNAVNSPEGGSVHYGIYKSPWSAGQVGEVTERIIYFDNVKITC